MKIEDLERTPPWEWPGSAASILLRVLENRGAPERDRKIAAELAGDVVVINDELVTALLRIIADSAESEELRGSAAIDLGPVLELADSEGFDEADPFADVPITAATFDTIRRELHRHFRDASVPGEVRRRVLEASVRAPQEWHANAVRATYHSSDELWRLTAVFCMRHVAGFETEILEALEIAETPDIHFEAILAAGEWGVKPAWRHVVRLIRQRPADRDLLLAAISAAASIRPRKAVAILAGGGRDAAAARCAGVGDEPDRAERVYEIAVWFERGRGMWRGRTGHFHGPSRTGVARRRARRRACGPAP